MPEKRPRVSEALADRIDAVRGDIPFERWVTRVLEAHVDAVEKQGGVPPVVPALGEQIWDITLRSGLRE